MIVARDERNHISIGDLSPGTNYRLEVTSITEMNNTAVHVVQYVTKAVPVLQEPWAILLITLASLVVVTGLFGFLWCCRKYVSCFNTTFLPQVHMCACLHTVANQRTETKFHAFVTKKKETKKCLFCQS